MSKPLEGAMTDAGEKLVDRASQYWHIDSDLEKNEVDALVEFARAELERAAVEADGMIGATRHEIAAAIRRRKD